MIYITLCQLLLTLISPIARFEIMAEAARNLIGDKSSPLHFNLAESTPSGVFVAESRNSLAPRGNPEAAMRAFPVDNKTWLGDFRFDYAGREKENAGNGFANRR